MQIYCHRQCLCKGETSHFPELENVYQTSTSVTIAQGKDLMILGNESKGKHKVMCTSDPQIHTGSVDIHLWKVWSNWLFTTSWQPLVSILNSPKSSLFSFFFFKIVIFVSGSQVVKLSQNRFNGRTDSKPYVRRCTESSRHMCKHTRNLVGTIEHWSCHLYVVARNGYLHFHVIHINVTVLFNTYIPRKCNPTSPQLLHKALQNKVFQKFM